MRGRLPHRHRQRQTYWALNRGAPMPVKGVFRQAVTPWPGAGLRRSDGNRDVQRPEYAPARRSPACTDQRSRDRLNLSVLRALQVRSRVVQGIASRLFALIFVKVDSNMRKGAYRISRAFVSGVNVDTLASSRKQNLNVRAPTPGSRYDVPVKRDRTKVAWIAPHVSHGVTHICHSSR